MGIVRRQRDQPSLPPQPPMARRMMIAADVVNAGPRHLQVTVGHVHRVLALLGGGLNAGSAFARVAVMPVVRSRLNVGGLDMGGSRGDCAGLFFLLDDIANSVRVMYGGIEEKGEEGGDGASGSAMEMDFVKSGVRVPVTTALMPNPGIKMGIFCPGDSQRPPGELQRPGHLPLRAGERPPVAPALHVRGMRRGVIDGWGGEVRRLLALLLPAGP